MKIQSIRFAAGRSVGAEPLTVATKPVTVFVGPNYSGKSRAIEDIQNIVASGSNHSSVVISDLTLSKLGEADAEKILEEMLQKPNPGESVTPGNAIYGYRGSRVNINTDYFKNVLINPEVNIGGFSQWYAQYRMLMLNGSNRISLSNDQSGGDLQSPPSTSFQTIFRDDHMRARLSKIVHDAFGLYLTVDPTSLGSLRIRLSSTCAPSPEVERGLTAESVAFHGAAVPVTSTSDGAKAFVGILSEILAGNPDILLIDEPEAFLHPSLAFLLGKEIANEVGSSDKQMFVSTHSPNFIMGCLQSGVDVDVIRLTYRDGVATARLLPGDELRRMIRNPLLRSTGVISALFYESVIVTEADPDRAFYQEINERLIRENKGRGIPNAIFLNAQNKQTIPTIVAPLRSLGIPAAAIYDIDFVKDGGKVYTSHLDSASVPEISKSALNASRTSVLTALQASGKEFKREGGVSVLSKPDEQSAKDYLEQLKSYGLFVLPNGELEHWLSDLGVKGHGPSWLIKIFELMGEDPNAAGFVRPTDGDVWSFLDEVRAWLHKPDRKGIPQ